MTRPRLREENSHQHASPCPRGRPRAETGWEKIQGSSSEPIYPLPRAGRMQRVISSCSLPYEKVLAHNRPARLPAVSRCLDDPDHNRYLARESPAHLRRLPAKRHSPTSRSHLAQTLSTAQPSNPDHEFRCFGSYKSDPKTGRVGLDQSDQEADSKRTLENGEALDAAVAVGILYRGITLAHHQPCLTSRFTRGIEFTNHV